MKTSSWCWGASAAKVRTLLGDVEVDIVEATDWSDGMGASLRAGLTRVGSGPADAALVHLVDLPDVGADVVRRVAAHASRSALARATYNGVPGHPVLVGRERWGDVIESAVGDRGARDYLATHDVVEVDCSDLASGHDVDQPSQGSGSMLGR